MWISDITELDKRRVRIYLDEEFFCALYKGEVRRFSLVKDMDLPEDIYFEIMDILRKRGKERAFHLLERKAMTEHEVADKLAASFLPTEVIESTLEMLHKYGYVDDAQYVKDFYEMNSKRKSMREITTKLYTKGISRELIEQLRRENVQDASKVIRRQYGKLLDRYSEMDMNERRKFYQKLLRKGFSYEDISDALRDVTIDDN